MAEPQRRLKIWYDAEGDYLEVIFDQKAGYFRETENDQVMEKVDDEGNVLGFSVLRVSAMKESPPYATRGASESTDKSVCATSKRTLDRWKLTGRPADESSTFCTRSVAEDFRRGQQMHTLYVNC